MGDVFLVENRRKENGFSTYCQCNLSNIVVSQPDLGFACASFKGSI